MREVFQVEIDRLKEKRPELVEPITETPASTYLNLAINTTKLRKRAFTSLDQLLKNKDLKFAFKEGAPFAIASKADATKVITYPSIPRTIDPETLAEHANGLWSDGRKRKKIEDHERASSYAMKREVTTFGKFLMKYSNLKELGYKDDEIRSFCERLAVEVGPPRVVVCETVSDYVDMFRVKTGSCMQVGTDHWGDWSKKSIKQIAEDTGIYLAAWYHYAPWCKGAYVVVGGVPVARFMLYREDLTKDEYPFYGDVRGASINYQKVMDAFLAEKGIKAYGKSAKTLAEFRIPGFTHPVLEERWGKQLYCPIGAMDYQQKDFEVMFDNETDEFYFGPRGRRKGAKPIYDTYQFEGFIRSSEVPAFQ